MPFDHAAEHRALRQSVWAGAGMAAMGLGAAAASGSDAVLLDGAWSLVGFGMALLADHTAQLVEAPSTPHFQFGKAALEPLMNTARGLILLVLLLVAVLSAVAELRGDGRPLGSGPVLAYAVVAGAVCLAFGARQAALARRTGSSLLELDAAAWRIDGALSLGIGVAFVVGTGLDAAGIRSVEGYIDPLVVLAMSGWLVREPAREVWTNLTEVAQVAPPPEVMARLQAAVDAATATLPVHVRQVKAARLGRFLHVQVTLLSDDRDVVVRVGELDAARTALSAALVDEAAIVKVDLMVTTDARWLGRGWAHEHEA